MFIIEDPPPKPSSDSRMSLAIITEPSQANPFDTLHGGVILKLADECGGIAALRHAGKGQITTAAIDSMIFLGPVYVGERVEVTAEVTYVGRTSIETRIEVFAEPIDVIGTTQGRDRLCALRFARRDGKAAAASPSALDRHRCRPPRCRGSASAPENSPGAARRGT